MPLTLHHSIKALKKSDALDVIGCALSAAQSSDSDVISISINEAEALFKYFIPSLPKTPKEGWQWVAQAVDTKDVRSYLRAMHSNGTYLSGTDGHRLHRIKTDLEAGFYCPKTCIRLDDLGKFPPTDDIFFNSSLPEKAVIYLADCATMVTQRDGRPATNYEVAPDVWVFGQYLLQALAGMATTIIELERPPTPRVRGSNRFGDWVIMPTKV